MALSVECEVCKTSFRLPAALWQKRVAGRVLKIPCKKCRAPITLDGTADRTGTADASTRDDDKLAAASSASLQPRRHQETEASSTPTEPLTGNPARANQQAGEVSESFATEATPTAGTKPTPSVKLHGSRSTAKPNAAANSTSKKQQARGTRTVAQPTAATTSPDTKTSLAGRRSDAKAKAVSAASTQAGTLRKASPMPPTTPTTTSSVTASNSHKPSNRNQRPASRAASPATKAMASGVAGVRLTSGKPQGSLVQPALTLENNARSNPLIASKTAGLPEPAPLPSQPQPNAPLHQQPNGENTRQSSSADKNVPNVRAGVITSDPSSSLATPAAKRKTVGSVEDSTDQEPKPPLKIRSVYPRVLSDAAWNETDEGSIPSLRALEVDQKPGSGSSSQSADLAAERTGAHFEAPDTKDTDSHTPQPVQRRKGVDRKPSSVLGWALTLAAAAAVLFTATALVMQPSRTPDGTTPNSGVQGSVSDTVNRTSNATPRAPQDSPAEPEPQTSPADAGTETPQPPTYNAERLGFALSWARGRAATCTQFGSSVPNVDVSVTFGADGKVSNVFVVDAERLNEGKVRCIKLHYRSALIPAFDGEPFEVNDRVVYY